MLIKSGFKAFETYNHIFETRDIRTAAVLLEDILENLVQEKVRLGFRGSGWNQIVEWCKENCQGAYDNNDVIKIDNIDFTWWVTEYREPKKASTLFAREPKLKKHQNLIFGHSMKFEFVEDAEYFFWVWA